MDTMSQNYIKKRGGGGEVLICLSILFWFKSQFLNRGADIRANMYSFLPRKDPLGRKNSGPVSISPVAVECHLVPLD